MRRVHTAAITSLPTKPLVASSNLAFVPKLFQKPLLLHQHLLSNALRDTVAADCGTSRALHSLT